MDGRKKERMVYGGRWLILKWIYETLQAVLAVSKGMNETMKQCSERAEASRCRA